MIRAFYSGKEGLKNEQTAMDNIANNMANINTTGYKAKTTQFSDVLYSSMFRPDFPGYATTHVGNGVATARIESNMADGTPTETENTLDYCPRGEGFFAVQDEAGNTYYTRDGSFSAINEGGTTYLRNGQGLYVLDAAGNRITVGADQKPAEDPGLFTFSNSQGLLNAGENLFTRSATSGAPTVSNEGFMQGYLEGSNVDMAGEMTRMIVTQRGFQMSGSVVQTANQIEGMVNDLKG